MRHCSASVCAFVLFLAGSAVFAESSAYPLFAEESENPARAHEIASRYPEEIRQIIVQTPPSYTRDRYKRYPVLYLLDGDRQIKQTVATVNSLVSRRKMPEIVVVALPNSSLAIRERDYKPAAAGDDGVTRGGAETFLAFLEHELLPHIDSHYRTEPFRMLAGHSRGGLFVIHALLTRPDLFQAHFAFSPALWHDDDAIVERARETLSSDATMRNFLFMNLGGKENENITNSFDRMHYLLRRQAPASLRWHAGLAEDESHGTTPLLGQYQALRRLFTHYSLPLRDLDAHALAAIRDHHERLSLDFGYQVTPPERTLNSVGYRFLADGEVDVALEAFELNLMYYPQSPNGHDSLADGLEAAGRPESALEMVERACELAARQRDPRLEAFLAHRKRLREDHAHSDS